MGRAQTHMIFLSYFLHRMWAQVVWVCETFLLYLFFSWSCDLGPFLRRCRWYCWVSWEQNMRERERDKESIPTVHNFQGIFFLFFFSHFPFLHEVPNKLEQEKKKAMCDLLSWTKGDYLSPASLKHWKRLICNDETWGYLGNIDQFNKILNKYGRQHNVKASVILHQSKF